MLFDLVPKEILYGAQVIVGLLAFYVLLKILKAGVIGVFGLLAVGFVFLVISGAAPFIPDGPPEYFKITKSDMVYMKDMQEKGYFDYEFGVNLFFGE